MKQTRPVFLNLFQIRFPSPAIASILHRISGLIIFFMIPVLLYMLRASLRTEASFQVLQKDLGQLWVKIIIFGLLAALLYHLVAGIRHLLMDMHLGESKAAGKASAYVTFIISILLIIGAGVWLW